MSSVSIPPFLQQLEFAVPTSLSSPPLSSTTLLRIVNTAKKQQANCTTTLTVLSSFLPQLSKLPRSAAALSSLLHLLQDKQHNLGTITRSALDFCICASPEDTNEVEHKLHTLQHVSNTLNFSSYTKLCETIPTILQLCENTNGDKYAFTRLDLELEKALNAILHTPKWARIPSGKQFLQAFSTARVLVSNCHPPKIQDGEQHVRRNQVLLLPNGAKVGLGLTMINGFLMVSVRNVGCFDVRVAKVGKGSATGGDDVRVFLPGCSFFRRVLRLFPTALFTGVRKRRFGRFCGPSWIALRIW